MSKKELLKHKMTRMTDTMKADIQASADKHSEGVFAVELRALIEIGLRVRKQEIEKLSAVCCPECGKDEVETNSDSNWCINCNHKWGN